DLHRGRVSALALQRHRAALAVHRDNGRLRFHLLRRFEMGLLVCRRRALPGGLDEPRHSGEEQRREHEGLVHGTLLLGLRDDGHGTMSSGKLSQSTAPAVRARGPPGSSCEWPSYCFTPASCAQPPSSPGPPTPRPSAYG